MLMGVNRPDIAQRQGASEASIEIRDNGPGVPADLRDRVFDPFVTTKDVGAGSGLGTAEISVGGSSPARSAATAAGSGAGTSRMSPVGRTGRCQR